MEFFGTREKAINDALQTCAQGLKRERGGWRFELLNGHRHILHARFMHENWLVLEAQDLHAARGVDPCRLLMLNGQLAESLKFIFTSQPSRATLRAEVFIDDETDIRTRTERACAGLKGALHNFYSSNPEEKRTQLEERKVDLEALCSAAGWAFNERAEGHLAVELETRRGFHQALVERMDGSCIRAQVELAAGEHLSTEGQRALSIMLLQLCARLKMARAVVSQSAATMSAARLECVLSPDASVVELNCALSSLSMACDMCMREVGVIGDKSIAARYLAAQGWT